MINSFIDILFPRLCPFCATTHCAEEEGLCEGCAEALGLSLVKGPVCEICGVPFRSSAGGDHRCGRCVKKTPPFVMARSLYVFDTEVREAVHALKYRWQCDLAPTLGAFMAGLVRKMGFDVDMIVPVPLHRKKIRQRGFNQSVLLARRMAEVLSAGVQITNLLRSRHTASQVGLSVDERKKNVRGAFSVRDPLIFRDKKVILVDDVFTSGATVGECSRVLKRAGASVAVVTLARVVMD